MKRAYSKFKKASGIWYSQEVKTGRQKSLHTKDDVEAESLLAALNDAANHSSHALLMAKTWSQQADPELNRRTWADVMKYYEARTDIGLISIQRGKREYAQKRFDALRQKKICETTSDDFNRLLRNGTKASKHYTRILHRLALDLGWLLHPLVAKRFWPRRSKGNRRAITHEEFHRILASETNPERHRYYRLLWEIGAAQTDAAMLGPKNIEGDVLSYTRKKTGEQCCLRIGATLRSLLDEMPSGYWFFPELRTWNSEKRGIKFINRCRVAKVSGVSLHSFRYSWAQRAYELGVPERLAMAALGHGSRAIHHAYSKGAVVVCPPFDGYTKGK